MAAVNDLAREANELLELLSPASQPSASENQQSALALNSIQSETAALYIGDESMRRVSIPNRQFSERPTPCQSLVKEKKTLHINIHAPVGNTSDVAEGLESETASTIMKPSDRPETMPSNGSPSTPTTPQISVSSMNTAPASLRAMDQFNTSVQVSYIPLIKWSPSVRHEETNFATVKVSSRIIPDDVMIAPHKSHHHMIPVATVRPVISKVSRGIASPVLHEATLLSFTKYFKIGKVIPKPTISADMLSEFPKHVFSYIFQRVKFGSGGILTVDNISQLVNEQATVSTSFLKPVFRPTKSKTANAVNIHANHPVSRLDCITYMLNSVENIVASELLRIMSQFPMALPLVLRDVDRDFQPHYKLTSPLMSGIIIRWDSGTGMITEHSLFHNNYKMLLAIRLGDNDKGKSAILNQFLSTDFTFSTREESIYGKPKSLDGSVEMIWLTQETCKPSFWNEVARDYYRDSQNQILLLANMHGNASDHMERAKFLVGYYSCSAIVFVMPNCTPEMFDEMMDSLGNRVAIIYVDDPCGDMNDPSYLQTCDITSNRTARKVHACFRATLASCMTCNDPDGKTASFDGVGLPRDLTLLQPLTLDDTLAKFLKLLSLHSFEKVKRCIMEYVSAEDEASAMERPTEDWQLLREICSLFSSLLCRRSPDNTQRAILRIEKELTLQSSIDLQETTNELPELADKRNKTHSRGICEDIKKKMASVAKKAENSRLNIEHFYRLVGHVYESLFNGQKTEIKKHLCEKYYKIPSHVASQLLRGQSIELLDGDSNAMPELWLEAIRRQLHRQHPNLRVFVVSIIGLQSSGKSTLLNSLFACRFPVSVGRCSRGLLMRLLMLDDDLVKSDGYDAILLIDSEGLGSPERVNDLEAGKKDRLLATFAMGISHLTLINTLGENTNELTGILQIALIVMTRLEKVGLSPDIFLVQHNIAEKNSKTISQANVEFSEALRSAAALAEEHVVDVGVRNNNCLATLMERLEHQTHLIAFRPYKNGATVHAPPSDSYHEDVVCLYEKILEFAKKATEKKPMTFDTWYELVQHIWNCAKQENFAIRFKDIQQMREFISRGEALATVKRAIDDAFRFHNITYWQLKIEQSSDCTEFPDTIDSEIDSIPDQCNRHCELCKTANGCRKSLFVGVENGIFKEETETTVKTYIDNVRRNNRLMLHNFFSRRQSQQGHNRLIDNLIKEQVVSRFRNNVQRDDAEVNAVVDDIYEAVRKQVAADETKHGDVRDRFRSTLKSDYESIPDFVEQFDRKPVCFEEIRDASGKFMRETTQKLVENLPLVTAVTNFFTGTSRPAWDMLKEKLQSMPHDIFSDRKIEFFEDGIIAHAKVEIGKCLDSFGKKSHQLQPVTQTQLHVWAQQLLCLHAETVQDKWNKNNSVSGMLVDNKDYYKQVITGRVKFGIGNAQSESKIVAKLLVGAIRKTIIDNENDQLYRTVRSRIAWISSPVDIHLQYFSSIANDVLQGKRRKALAHFKSPKQAIEKWFKSIIDGDNSPRFNRTIRPSFRSRSLFNNVCRRLRRAKTVQEFNMAILDTVGEESYTAIAHSIISMEYQYTFLKEAVLSELNGLVVDLSVFTSDMFCPASQNSDIMALLGCTEQCPWCGALCWGERDHVNNQNENKKHFTCHQPCGFGGRTDENTYLSSIPCHDFPEKATLYIGAYADRGITWREAKRKLYDDWKFERLYNKEFDQLMLWFFQELHRDIATEYGVQPARPQDLQKTRCTRLMIQYILGVMNSQIEHRKTIP